MVLDSGELAFNIKAVVKETGIPAETLRVWERRYGVPLPERSMGRQRLYSRRDIELVKWLLARQDEGLSISRAIALWQQMSAGGGDPLAASQRVAVPPPDQSLDSLRAAWLEACMAFREQDADAVLAQAFALYQTEAVCAELLQKGLSEVGQAWFEGRATVHQEHYASARAIHQLERLIAASPVPFRRERVLVACPAEEQHTFAPLFITLFLRRRGWDTLFLGARVPAEEMDATVAETNPRLAILSAQRLPTAALLADSARVLDRLGVMVGYGGLVFNLFPGLRSRVSGHFLGDDLTGAAEEAERLLLSPKANAPVEEPLEEYRTTLRSFRSGRSAIEAGVWRRLGALGLSARHLAIANVNLGDDLAAALQLGDLDLVRPDLIWLDGRLHPRDGDEGALLRYLRLYRLELEQQMGQSAALISRWMREYERQDGDSRQS